MSTSSQSSTLVNRDDSSSTDGSLIASPKAEVNQTAVIIGEQNDALANDVDDVTSSMAQIYRILYILAFFFALFILILIISYFAWGCARRQKDFSFECLFESKSLRSQPSSRYC